MGMNFVSTDGSTSGPDLLQIVHTLARSSLPEDIRDECFDGIRTEQRITAKDWIVIWGGR